MSTNNPTSLRIGMSGQLLDRTYKICGRVTLSTDVDGERYYWQEFFLKASNGEEATLVFEETERGPTWKLFQYFEPQAPFSIVDLSRVNVGDTVGVDDFKGTVDLIGKSTVRAIEGEAPEGVERGDYSQYFNATAGDATLVVSWANGEVEHYVGQDLTRNIVRNAFGAELPASYTNQSFSSTNSESSSQPFSFGKILGVAVLALFLIFQFTRCAPISCSTGADFPSRAAPAAKLEISNSLLLAGRNQRVTSCAIVEYATIHFTRQARLYELMDDAGNRSQVLQGIENEEKKWVFLDSLTSEPITDRTPQQLGALQAGAAFKLGGKPMTVATLYRLRVLRVTAGKSETFPTGKVRYGFIAGQASDWTMVDWDENSSRACKMTVLSNIATN